MLLWYPVAIKSAPGNSSGAFVPGPMRGVLHTTEGFTAEGAISAYRRNNSWPHFTVNQEGMVWQHLPLNVAARSLENRPGGVETNRQGAIQIEVVGYAANPKWTLAQVDAMFFLMRWIEEQTGIHPHGPAFGYNTEYGVGNALEFTNKQWLEFDGWCGHQHVPENAHWDPGHLDLTQLLPKGPVMADTPIYRVNAPTVGAIASLDPATGDIKGYIIFCADGGVFSFGQGAPYLGRVEYVLPAEDGWTPPNV